MQQPLNQTLARGRRFSVRGTDKMWRIVHEWLASAEMLLTGLASLLSSVTMPVICCRIHM